MENITEFNLYDNQAIQTNGRAVVLEDYIEAAQRTVDLLSDLIEDAKHGDGQALVDMFEVE